MSYDEWCYVPIVLRISYIILPEALIGDKSTLIGLITIISTNVGQDP